MACATSDLTSPPLPLVELKIVVAGGFGVGKTTMVAALSEIVPLTTEGTVTVASEGVDDLSAVAGKTQTTVALDFGRITFREPQRQVILYLFGTPGQDRFQFTWEGLAYGAVGAIVLVDTRRLEDSFTAISFFEDKKIPFVVAMNHFDGTHHYETAEVRDALELHPRVPVLTCDVRVRTSARDTLSALVQHSLHCHQNPGALA
ncbi:GTP-binding protein [Streptomyces venezuelae]|uniref:GTP-binding protein n=1 Tax=Streptomyces venezuelae TaxID=54571 RepID=UPI00341DD2D5